MHSDPARQALLDMRANIELATAFIGTMTVAELEADRRTFYAATRCLEIISEAARRLPSALRERHAHLPWRAIMGVGNIYRHEYDNVAEDFIWRTVRHSLAPLLAVVELELREPSHEA